MTQPIKHQPIHNLPQDEIQIKKQMKTTTQQYATLVLFLIQIQQTRKLGGNMALQLKISSLASVNYPKF
jgi:hypothetical protein